MKRFHFLFLLLIICHLPGRAQVDSYTITGTVVDHEGEPLAFAAIQLTQKDSIITLTLSQESGQFELKANPGAYRVEIVQFDTALFNQSLTIDGNLDLGKLEVNTSIALNEVLIETQEKLIERKADRLRFNVENLPVKSFDGFEILKQTPGLLVQNESVSVIGRKGVRILVDGQLLRLSGESLLTYLKNLEGDQIKAIEVITNPPAKYSAEGNSGLVNLVLKKSKRDHWYNSSTVSGWQSTYASYSLSDNFYYQKDKLSVGAGISIIQDNPYSLVKKEINYPDKIYDQETRFFPKNTYFNPKFGIDYEFNDWVTSGLQVDYFKSDADRLARDEIGFLSPNRERDSLTVNNSKVVDKGRKYALNYHLIVKMDSVDKKRLRLDFDVLDKTITQRNRNDIKNYDKDHNLSQNAPSVLDDDHLQSNRGYYLKLDMDHPIGTYVFNYGIDLSWARIKSDIAHLTPDLEEIADRDIFHYKEHIQSGYFSVNRSFGEKWEVQLGLRAERTQTHGNSESESQKNKRSYTDLFPSGYIAYNLNPKHNFTLNYGRRINRPFFTFLNPHRSDYSQYSYSIGNPDLTPSYSNNLELNYLFDQSLNVQLYYTHTSDEFGSLQFADPLSPIVYEQPENYAQSDIYGLTVFYSFTKLKGWQSLASFNYNYASTTSYIPEAPPSLKGNNAYFNLNNTVKLTKNLSFNANYYYFFSGVSNLDHNAARNYLDLRLSLSLLKDQLNIALSGQDVFKSNRFRSLTYSSGIRMDSNTFTNNHIKLLLRYKFGNKDINRYQYEYNEAQYRM